VLLEENFWSKTMDQIVLERVVTAGLGVIGAVSLARLRYQRANKTRLELLKELDEAVRRASKQAATEIFRLLYVLSLNYEDLQKLLSNDDANRIIHALRRAPALIEFESGLLRYREPFSWGALNHLPRFLICLSLLLTVTVLAIAGGLFVVTTDGRAAMTLFVVIVFLAFVMRREVDELAFEKMVRRLIAKSR
jgi:hypothetical protein